MASPSDGSKRVVFILKEQKTGLGLSKKEGEEAWPCHIYAGELVVEIPEEERATVDGAGAQPDNYRLYSDPEVVFYAAPDDVAPLEERQLDYLLAVQPASVRLQEYLKPAEEMKRKMELAIGNEVMFSMIVNRQSPESHVNGIIRYIGPLPETEGVYFGIEILEEQYRGKGTCNGRPRFSCDPNNAVYVAMDKIILPATATSDHVATGGSQFKVGDRVVLQSAKGDTITGTVRILRTIRKSTSDISAVGVETDKKIDANEHFPKMQIKVGIFGNKKLFEKESADASRVLLPAHLVTHANECAQKPQEKRTSVSQFTANTDTDSSGPSKQSSTESTLTEQTNSEPLQSETHDSTPNITNNPVGVSVSETSENSETITQEQQEETKDQTNSEYPKTQENDVPSDSQGREKIEETNDIIHEDEPSNASPQTEIESSNQLPSPNMFDKSNNDKEKQDDPPEAIVPKASDSPQAAPQETTERADSSSLPSDTPLDDNNPFQITTGSMVCMKRGQQPLPGVVMWIGTLPDNPQEIMAGVEMEKPLIGCTDGTWKGKRYFKCPPGRAFFCPVAALTQDTRFIDEGQIPANLRKDIPNPLVDKAPETVEENAIFTPNLFTKYIGDEHGIQGHHNSCYLDSTVFGLFALSDSFDELLLEEPQEEVGRQVKYYLWKGIVNPLRKYGLARHESVMSLRNSLEEFGRMKGAKTDEKDPEEFLNLLCKEVLHVDPFLSIKRPFGVEKEYFIQLFFEIDPKETQIPKTDKLLAQMFHEQNISLTRVPSKLLLQMPRFGKEFKMYNSIIPSLTLDVKPLLDPDALKCCSCSSTQIAYECHTCIKDDSYLLYCTDCYDEVHKEVGTVPHCSEEVQTDTKLQLLSVICIETSHYVCYTRSGDRWLFHDSMADRVYDMYNIPKVIDVTQELQDWVYSEKNAKRLVKTPDKKLPHYVRRFTQDIYMCVYVNADLDKCRKTSEDDENKETSV